jgi:predicted type IV restriction endonuclease
MDLIDNLRVLASRITNTRDLIQTEEATKNSMIMPLIQLLGYNVFDPLEVTPEFIADIGTKKGEKVDYAILRDGKPVILFECKKAGDELNIKHAGQLFRYFHVTSSRFGVLTNGLIYHFFTDLEQPNKMDEKPFFEFNILDFKDRDVEELKKFAKSSFDVDAILTTANDLKYTRLIQNKLSDWMANPSEDFVRLVTADLLENRRFTAAIKEQFTSITKRAFEQLINERINQRLKGALASEDDQKRNSATGSITGESIESPESEIITTQHELEAFYIIRTIVRDVLPSKRIFIRDSASYCAVIVDDNNRKTLCRLRFNNSNRLGISLFNDKKEEERISINEVDDLHLYTEKLREAALRLSGE